MLAEITESGRPSLRHTLGTLVLMGEYMWLESSDQLGEDKLYRYNQTLQELLTSPRRCLTEAPDALARQRSVFRRAIPGYLQEVRGLERSSA